MRAESLSLLYSVLLTARFALGCVCQTPDVHVLSCTGEVLRGRLCAG